MAWVADYLPLVAGHRGVTEVGCTAEDGALCVDRKMSEVG